MAPNIGFGRTRAWISCATATAVSACATASRAPRSSAVWSACARVIGVSWALAADATTSSAASGVMNLIMLGGRSRFAGKRTATTMMRKTRDRNAERDPRRPERQPAEDIAGIVRPKVDPADANGQHERQRHADEDSPPGSAHLSRNSEHVHEDAH